MTCNIAAERRNRKQKGQAMVEGALVTVSLIFIIISIVEIGRYMLFVEFFTERARAGARYASTNTWNAATIKNWICYNSATAPAANGDGTAATGMFGLTPSQITVNRYNQSEDTDRIEVSIGNYSLTLFSPLMPNNWTLRTYKVTFTAESMGATD
jgi:Flp pilus assembly protein TadG